MSKNSSKKRRLEDRKRKKRDAAKRRARAHAASRNSAAGRMRRFGRWPLLECRISRSWKDEAFGHVVIARQEGPIVAAGLFMVDLGCLGVKDCSTIPGVDDLEYRAFVDRVLEDGDLVPCDPPLAVKVIETAVAYASSLGFRPAVGYDLARGIFGDIDPSECAESVPCGKDGKPFYVSGPDDDVERVLRTLEARRGPGGFDCIVAPDLDDDRFDEDDDEDEDEDGWQVVPVSEWDDPELETALRLRLTEAVLLEELCGYLWDRYDEEHIEAASREFWFGENVPIDSEKRQAGGSLLAQWLAFDWDPRSLPGREPGGPERPAARTFLDEHGDRLNEFQRRFIEEGLSRPLRPYRIAKVSGRPGLLGRIVRTKRKGRLDIEDLVTGEIHRVADDFTTEQFESGDVVLSRLIALDGDAILACSPWSIPGGRSFDLRPLRDAGMGTKGDDPTGTDSRQFERDARRLFFDALRELEGEGRTPIETTPDRSSSRRGASRGNRPSRARPRTIDAP